MHKKKAVSTNLPVYVLQEALSIECQIHTLSHRPDQPVSRFLLLSLLDDLKSKHTGLGLLPQTVPEFYSEISNVCVIQPRNG